MVDGGVVELASDHEDDCSDGVETGVAPGLSLGGLEEPVDRFEGVLGEA